MALSKENIARITDLLRDNPTGLSITDIVKKTGINRNTAGRYLERLLISGQVEMRHFGMAKIYTASQRVPVSAMLSISSDLVMQLDSGLRIIFANRPFLQLLGVTSEKLLGKNIEFTAAATVFDEVLETFISHLKNGVCGKEWRSTLTLNNGERIFSCHISPITFNDGRKGVSVLLEEVTEIRKKESALRESEERFRTLVEISPDAVILHRDGKIIYANLTALKLLGASYPEEITGKMVLDFVDPGFHGILRENIRKDLDGELSPQMELPMLRLDGTPVIVEGRGTKTSIEGKPAVMVTLRDITDRRQAEEKLFNSRQMLQLVLDTIPVRVFWKDRDSVYLGASQTFALDTGYADPGELVGRTDYDSVSAAMAEKYRADDRKVMETGTPKLNFKERQVRRDGSTAWLRTSKVPLRNKSGDVIGILGTYEDITEHKMLEDELNATAERYKQLAECSLDALVITDLRGEVITTNKAALALVELEDNTEVQGTSVFRFLAPESRERAQRDFAAMSPSRKAVMQTYTGITARGNRITVEAMGNPITYKGSPANIISIREISKRTFTEDNPGTNG